MQYKEARQKFIQTWGSLGSSWGINRTMAQIHALLLLAPDPISTEEIMEELNISRGNASMNIRALIDWGLATRTVIPGERREFYTGEKDIWAVARQIMKERRKREIDPLLKALDDLKEVEGDKRHKEIKQFHDTVSGISGMVGKADKTISTLIFADEHWLMGTFMKLMK